MPNPPAGPTPEWLYAKVHPRDPSGGLDPVITRVVPAAVTALTTSREDVRWFWLRYVDHAGAHLRLRVRARPAVLDELLAVVDEAAAGDTVTLGVYEPEDAVFGGAEGVARAERCFESSSRLALRVVQEHPWGRRRLGVAAGLLWRAVELLPPASRSGHLRDVEAYWRRGGAPPSGPRELDVPGGLAGPPDPDAAAWLREVGAPLDWAQAPTRSAWVFRHAHLMLNRLGVTPPLEAALAAGLAARLDAAAYVVPDG